MILENENNKIPNLITHGSIEREHLWILDTWSKSKFRQKKYNRVIMHDFDHIEKIIDLFIVTQSKTTTTTATTAQQWIRRKIPIPFKWFILIVYIMSARCVRDRSIDF